MPRWGLALLMIGCGARSSLDGAPSSNVVDASSPIDAIATDASDVAVPIIGVPRAIAPLSTSAVTSRRPTFRWVGANGARVEICADRACSTIETAFDAIGSSGQPPSDLAPGIHFYRLRGSDSVDATREFLVPKRSAPHDASWGTFPDFDGDGYADVVVRGHSAFTIFPGSPSGIHHKLRVEMPDPAQRGLFSVASAGDVDGDGYDDLVLASDVQQPYPANRYLYLYRGGPNGIRPTDTPQIVTGPPGYHAWNVSSAGDLNGDGYADVVVANSTEPPMYVYFGSASGLEAQPAIQLDGRAFVAAEAGDVDGDGYADLVASIATDTLTLYRGGPSGPSNASSVAIHASPHCSWSVSISPGDVNGDGLADIAAGGLCGANLQNGVSIFYGGTSFASPVVLHAPSPYSFLGKTLSFAGDVNGDGYDDLAVSTSSLAGALFFGSPEGLKDSSHTAFIAPDSIEGTVAAAGDLNKDGYADLLLAAPVWDNRVYVFAGNASSPIEQAIVAEWTTDEWDGLSLR